MQFEGIVTLRKTMSFSNEITCDCMNVYKECSHGNGIKNFAKVKKT